jgi:ubiquinone/menaquinone biosynthesis C-methylase UbiE
MGFFTLTLARLSGPNGKVIGVDLQERMLAGLRRRADKTGLSERIETRKSTRESLNTDDLAGSVDFVLAFAVVHEIPDQERLYRELYAVLKPKALVFIAEPGGIISEEAFDASLARAEERGFVILSRPFVHLSHGAILSKE